LSYRWRRAGGLSRLFGDRHKSTANLVTAEHGVHGSRSDADDKPDAEALGKAALDKRIKVTVGKARRHDRGEVEQGAQ